MKYCKRKWSIVNKKYINDHLIIKNKIKIAFTILFCVYKTFSAFTKLFCLYNTFSAFTKPFLRCKTFWPLFDVGAGLDEWRVQRGRGGVSGLIKTIEEVQKTLKYYIFTPYASRRRRDNDVAISKGSRPTNNQQACTSQLLTHLASDCRLFVACS